MNHTINQKYVSVNVSLRQLRNCFKIVINRQQILENLTSPTYINIIYREVQGEKNRKMKQNLRHKILRKKDIWKKQVENDIKRLTQK